MAFNLFAAGRCGGVPLLWACFCSPRGVRGGGGQVRLTVSVPCPHAVVCFVVRCCAVLCFAVPRRAVPRCALVRSAPLCRAVPCRVVLCLAVLWRAAFCRAAPRRVLLCAAVLRGGVVFCAAMWRSVFRCVVLCSALLRRAGGGSVVLLVRLSGAASAGHTGGFAVWVAGLGHVAGWRLVCVVCLGVARWVGAAGGLGVPSGQVGQVGVKRVGLPWSRALCRSLSLEVYRAPWGRVT